MDVYRNTLGDVLTRPIRLVAPLFQRPYVWREETNWAPLWQAIRETSERRRSGASRPYFLGTLVLSPLTPRLGAPVGTMREIIDGQQRLTTLQLFLRATVDALENHGAVSEAQAVARCLFNDVPEDLDELFLVWPTNVDRPGYRAAMRGEDLGSNFGAGIVYFRRCLEEYLTDEALRSSRIAALRETLATGLVFAVIDLGREDDSQLIFETLNSLGTPLLPSDLVKNLLFREAAVRNLSTDSLYERHWRPFEADPEYWRAEIGAGGRNRTRLDVFLQHYLSLKIGREPLASGLFRAYLEAFGEGRFGEVEVALKDLADHAARYRTFEERGGDEAERSFRFLLYFVGSLVSFPVALGIVTRAAPDERAPMFQTLESYVARRLICNLGSRAQGSLMHDLIVRLHATEWTDENLRAFLSAQQAVSFAWPHDGWVRDRVLNHPAYANIAVWKLRYLLVRYEVSLQTTKNEFSGMAGLDIGAMTVEHLMPQKWREHWPRPEPATPEAERDRDAAIHRFGNLTIIRTALNSSISNSAWEKKRQGLLEHARLNMNSRLAQVPHWDEDAIWARGEEIAAAFCRIWPRD